MAAWTAGVRPAAAVAVAVVVVAVTMIAAELGGGRLEVGIPPDVEPTGRDSPVTTADADGHVFRREGRLWRVGSGDAVFFLQDAKGLRCLHLLLQHPGRELYCVELAQHCEGVAISAQPGTRLPEGTQIGGDADLPVLDEQAKAQYRMRKGQLDAELEEAKSSNDEGRVLKLQSEIDELERELLGAIGWGGGDRKTGGQVEKARINVCRHVKKAIRDIGRHDPSLAHQLSSTIRTGTYCRYDPDPHRPPKWQL